MQNRICFSWVTLNELGKEKSKALRSADLNRPDSAMIEISHYQKKKTTKVVLMEIHISGAMTGQFISALDSFIGV